MNTIEGKRALVTGGTRGIGRAIASALLEKGASVFICGTSEKRVSQVTEELGDSGKGRVFGSVCNVREHAQVKALVKEAGKRLGGLDVLVNNAGIGAFHNVEDMHPEVWRALLETNLSGVFYCCREAIPVMKRGGGGYIVNIGSLAGKNAFPGGAGYNATKFGLVGFSEALMQEVRYDHIRVSYVMPGSVNTEFGQTATEQAAPSWKLSPGDVAQTIVHLLEMDSRALVSRVELRPSEPKK